MRMVPGVCLAAPRVQAGGGLSLDCGIWSPALPLVLLAGVLHFFSLDGEQRK